jgi:putative DNA primase/helicase
MSDTSTNVNAPINRKREFESSKTRPIALRVNLEGIPAELLDLDQWFSWKYVYSRKKEKWDKPPVNPRNRKEGSSTNPKTWAPSAMAYMRYLKQDYSGIGFVFKAGGGKIGTDLDNCRDPATGIVDEWALPIVTALNSYTDISPSGTGLKIICRGELPGGKGRKIKLPCGHVIELYDRGRYFALTGQRYDGTPATINDEQAAIDAILAMAPAEPVKARNTTTRTTSEPYRASLQTDTELIDIASRASNGSKFLDLWTGGIGAGPTDSEADLALCNLLAFYTHNDADRIDHLFRQSGRYRKKWERDDYRNDTIGMAMAGRTEFYDPDRNQPGERNLSPGAKAIDRYLRDNEPLPVSDATTGHVPDPIGNPWAAELGRALGDDGGTMDGPPPITKPPTKRTCPNCHRVALGYDDPATGRMIDLKWFPCKTGDCEVCGLCRKELMEATVRAHLLDYGHANPGELLYFFLCDPGRQWTNISSCFRDKKGRAIRVLGPILHSVVSDVAPPGSVENVKLVTPQEAIDLLVSAIHSLPLMRGRAFWGLRGWTLLQEDTKSDLKKKRIGEFTGTEEEAQRRADERSLETKGRSTRRYYWPNERTLTVALRGSCSDLHFLHEIEMGEWMEEVTSYPSVEEQVAIDFPLVL